MGVLPKKAWPSGSRAFATTPHAFALPVFPWAIKGRYRGVAGFKPGAVAGFELRSSLLAARQAAFAVLPSPGVQ
jgi:hypothetical protein